MRLDPAADSALRRAGYGSSLYQPTCPRRPAVVRFRGGLSRFPRIGRRSAPIYHLRDQHHSGGSVVAESLFVQLLSCHFWLRNNALVAALTCRVLPALAQCTPQIAFVCDISLLAGLMVQHRVVFLEPALRRVLACSSQHFLTRRA